MLPKSAVVQLSTLAELGVAQLSRLVELRVRNYNFIEFTFCTAL